MVVHNFPQNAAFAATQTHTGQPSTQAQIGNPLMTAGRPEWARFVIDKPAAKRASRPSDAVRAFSSHERCARFERDQQRHAFARRRSLAFAQRTDDELTRNARIWREGHLHGLVVHARLQLGGRRL